MRDLQGLDPAAVGRWLRHVGIEGDLVAARPLGGGTQNVVLAITVGERELVLRHPPLRRRDGSNRSMAREMRVLDALRATGVPHPRLVAGEEGASLLDGATVFVMERVDGFNPGDEPGPAAYDDDAWRAAATLDVAAVLAQVAALDVDELGLGDLGRPGDFALRQIDRTERTWEAVAATAGNAGSSAYPDVRRLCRWLRATRPPAGGRGLTHGDLHLNNVLLRRDTPRVAAVIDWEMVTVGDPLIDLGSLLACWPAEAGPAPVRTGERLAQRGRLPSRAEVVDRYAQDAPIADGVVDWYTALAATKLGVLLETTHARALRGEAPMETGERLHRLGAGLVELAEAIRAGTWSPGAG